MKFTSDATVSIRRPDERCPRLRSVRGVFSQAEHFAQADQPLLRIDRKNLRLHVFADFAALAELTQRFDVIAQPRRFLEQHCGRAGPLAHLRFYLADRAALFLPLHHHAATSESCLR